MPFVPEPNPREDYPLDPANPKTTGPPGRGGAVIFLAGQSNQFQAFVWQLSSALHALNLGLASYKQLRYLGLSVMDARAGYDAAKNHYCSVIAAWPGLADHSTTSIIGSLSVEGYITEVQVVSEAFSGNKPGQSSSQTVVYPYPSSSSSA